MVVVRNGSPRREAALDTLEHALRACGLDLRSGAAEAVRQLAPGQAVPASRLAPEGVRLDFAMQDAGEAIAPGADDLRVINRLHSGLELTEDDVVVFQDYALSTERMNDRPIRISRAALDALAEQYAAGRSVLLDHQWDRPIGSTFAADVVEETVRGVQAEWLRIRWFAVLTDDTSPDRRQLVQDCRTGALRFGSCGLYGGEWVFAELEGGDFEYVVQPAEDLHGREYSRVYYGANTGAGDHKFTASKDGHPSHGPSRPATTGPAAPPSPPSTRRVVLL